MTFYIKLEVNRHLDGRIVYLWIVTVNMFPNRGTHLYGTLCMAVSASVVETGTHISSFNMYDYTHQEMFSSERVNQF